MGILLSPQSSMSFAEAQALPQGAQLEAITQIIQRATEPDDLRQITRQILDPSSSLTLVTTRPLLNVLISRLSHSEDLLNFALDMIAPRTSTFEEQVATLREALATRYESQQEYLEAARVLQAISLESGQRVIGDDYKLKIYIRIIRCLLEEDEGINADAYLNRATLLIHTTNDAEILLHFKMSQARIFDTKRKFIEASQKYHELSLASQIEVSERAACLGAAMTCAVLAPAGPARARLLSTLCKDERAHELPNWMILEKMFLDRLIASQQVDEFSKTLKPHQLATLGDGTTVLSRAIIEHNLLAASRIYENIGIPELAELLALDTRSVERFARGMIESHRLSGEIDQVSGIIDFNVSLAQEGRETQRWDRAIESLLEEVEECTTIIEKQHPEWAKSRQAVTI